jgi:hypothetical protein
MKKTIVFAIGAALLLAGTLWLSGTIIVTPAKLHITAVRITNTECGKPLEFHIFVKNVGGTPFTGRMAVLISVPGNQIGHEFNGTIPAGGTYTDEQSTLNASFLADCCKPVCFTVTLGATIQGGVLPQWDNVPFKICTKPGSVVVVAPAVGR